MLNRTFLCPESGIARRRLLLMQSMHQMKINLTAKMPLVVTIKNKKKRNCTINQVLLNNQFINREATPGLANQSKK